MSDSYSVLVVEDDSNHQMLIKRSLAKRGDIFPIVEVASDTADALRLIQQMDFDCFLVDNILPTGNGLEFITTLQTQGVAGPFVLMTSAGTEELVVQAYRNKVSDYLTKDVGFWQDLPSILEQVIEAAQLERDNESRVRELERTNEGLDAVNTEVQVQFEELKSRRIATRELLAEAVENLNSVINETDDATQKKSLKKIQALLVKAAAASR